MMSDISISPLYSTKPTTLMRKSRTIHLSFTSNDEDAVIHNEIMRLSNLSFIPASVIIRENLKKVMKDQGTLAINPIRFRCKVFIYQRFIMKCFCPLLRRQE